MNIELLHPSESLPQASPLPDDVWLLIVSYLNTEECFQLGYTCTFHERLVFGNAANFEKVRIAKNMTDAGLASFLRRIDALHLTKELSLRDCCKLETGEGLAPLRGSAVLKSMDVRNVACIHNDRERLLPHGVEDFLFSILQFRPLEVRPPYAVFVTERMIDAYCNLWPTSGICQKSGCDAPLPSSLSRSHLLYFATKSSLPYCPECESWKCIFCHDWTVCAVCCTRRCSSDCCSPGNFSVCARCRQCQACASPGSSRARSCQEESCCRFCAQQCPVCHQVYCPTHGTSCESCSILLCARCNPACDTCRQVLCHGCTIDDGCDECGPEDDDERDEFENFGYWAVNDDD